MMVRYTEPRGGIWKNRGSSDIGYWHGRIVTLTDVILSRDKQGYPVYEGEITGEFRSGNKCALYTKGIIPCDKNVLARVDFPPKKFKDYVILGNMTGFFLRSGIPENLSTKYIELMDPAETVLVGRLTKDMQQKIGMLNPKSVKELYYVGHAASFLYITKEGNRIMVDEISFNNAKDPRVPRTDISKTIEEFLRNNRESAKKVYRERGTTVKLPNLLIYKEGISFEDEIEPLLEDQGLEHILLTPQIHSIQSPRRTSRG